MMSEPEVPIAKSSIWLRLIERWSRWTGASINRSIFGAALTVGLLSLGVKLVAAVKEVVVAKAFGTSDELDAFLAAFLLPFFAINVVSGSFNAALIPTFVRVRDREGREAAGKLLSSMLTVSLAILAGVALLLACSARAVLPLVASNFSPAKLALTRQLMYLLVPTLLICGLSTTWSAVLNAGQKFALAAVAPLITPLLTVAVLYAANAKGGIYSLAFATVAGLSAEALVLGWGLNRAGFSLLPRWHGLTEAVRESIGQYAPVAAGAVLMSGSLVVNQAMAAMLGPGSVAGLSYGSKVVSFILGTGSVALGTAVLPYFSRMVAAEDWTGVRHTVRTYVRLLTIAGVPVTVILVAGSQPLVRLLFERGNFTSDDTQVVARIAALFALQIPFYLAGQLGVRLLNALGKGRAIMAICAVNLTANLVGNWLFMKKMGVSGIALSTSVVYLVSCLQIFLVGTRELRRRTACSGA
jgi:putative peptidoglycan lipid II flippase